MGSAQEQGRFCWQAVPVLGHCGPVGKTGTQSTSMTARMGRLGGSGCPSGMMRNSFEWGMIGGGLCQNKLENFPNCSYSPEESCNWHCPNPLLCLYSCDLGVIS